MSRAIVYPQNCLRRNRVFYGALFNTYYNHRVSNGPECHRNWTLLARDTCAIPPGSPRLCTCGSRQSHCRFHQRQPVKHCSPTLGAWLLTGQSNRRNKGKRGEGTHHQRVYRTQGWRQGDVLPECDQPIRRLENHVSRRPVDAPPQSWLFYNPTIAMSYFGSGEYF